MRARAMMLSLVFLFTLLGGCLSGSLTAAAAPGRWAAGRTDELLAGGDRRIVLVALVGEGEGEINYEELSYAGNHPSVYLGPPAFVVQGEDVYVLDKANKCVHIWKAGNYNRIDISTYCPRADYLALFNGKLAVADNSTGATAVYSAEGELIVHLSHKEIRMKNHWVNGVTDIGENYIEWSGDKWTNYSYNWEKKKTDFYNRSPVLIGERIGFERYLVRDENTGMEWRIEGANLTTSYKGVHGNTLSYWSTSGTVEKIYIAEINGRIAMASFDSRNWYAAPLEPLYYSSEDGKNYVMECFEHYVVISEVLFDTYSRYQSENAAVQWPVSLFLEIQEVERCRME